MPKIDVSVGLLRKLVGQELPDTELQRLLPMAKAELDDSDPSAGLLRVELKDTNRPDLWSTPGLARQLRSCLGLPERTYDFFAVPGQNMDCGQRVIQVHQEVAQVRPFIVGFSATGREIGGELLEDVIQTQEKLCLNYGRKRRTVAMGIYRADGVQYPVHYRAVDPDATRFTPLGLDEKLSLREMLTRHPKGIEYGGIVADAPLFPFLTDAAGQVLSFPPVINSAGLGAVVPEDDHLFVELTGSDLQQLLLAAAVAACDLADAGFEIHPVKTVFPFDTPMGREVVCPQRFQEQASVELDFANQLLGEQFSGEQVVASIQRMGSQAVLHGNTVVVTPPPFRNDFLHAVDLVEEVMIGHGLEKFQPELPTDFTVGRLAPMERFARTVRQTLVGLGYQEMVFSYLGSWRDHIERMRLDGADTIRIANPMSENYALVRSSILPNLLGAETVSANARYPHLMFEVGKTVQRDATDNYGCVTRTHAGLLLSDTEAGFSGMLEHLAALLYYLSRTYELDEQDDRRFIPGRAARIMVDGRSVGVIGELHPEVLGNWGVQTPCVAAELALDPLLSESTDTA